MIHKPLSSDRKKKYLKYLLLVIFIPLIAITLLYLFFILPTLREDIYHEKIMHTEEMIDIGLSVFRHYYNLEQQGLLTREEAQAEAADIIRSLHYGESGLDYFWINDLEATVIVHPFRPDLEGQNVYDYQDREGFYLFQEVIRIAEEQGAGHLTYSWQYYDRIDRYEEKLSYVASFEPWNWIIGTGVYLNDLQAVIAGRRNVAIALMALFFGICTALALFYYKTRLTEQELLESEEKYRLIAEHTAETISILDLNFRYKYISPAVYRMKGFTAEEALKRNLEETLTPDSLQNLLALFCRQMDLHKKGMLDTDLAYRLELEEYCKDGSLIWVDKSISFITDENRQPVGILSVSRDITEQKLQQEALQKEQLEKSVILENLAELVTYMDSEMNIIWANPAAGSYHGLTADQYTGKKCYEVWHGYSEPCNRCPVKETLIKGEVCQEVITYPDGRCWKVTGSPVSDPNGEIIGVLDTALDITEMKIAENDLRQLNEELEERVRDRTVQLERTNKELAAFTYSVSHDLRAPLRSIEGFSKAVLEDHSEELDEEGKGYLARISAASKRMSDLIEDLLKLSRVTRQEIHRDQVNLSSMAEAYAVYLQDECGPREVEFRIAPDLYATGDGALLRIALENLIDNAWKYTGDVAPAKIKFGALENSGSPIYYLKDNGIGFDMKYADKLFKAFQRLHNPESYPGTGIGLSIVQRIIERHGGEVWAEAKPNIGATFYFTIPEQ